MDSLIFALNAVAPIIAMVAIGYILKKLGFMNEGFAKAANRLVFHVFLPVMLFLNVYKIDDIAGIDLGYIGYAIAALLVIFIIAIPAVFIFTDKKQCRGVLIQGAFRSNYALIGIPLAGALFGEEGEKIASLLSAVAIPAFNVLAVISLSVFKDSKTKTSIKKVLLEIIKNPLIQGVAAGLVTLAIRAVFVKAGIQFRLLDISPLEKVLTYLSNLATPLALLVLGAQFEFSAVSELKKEIIFGTLMKTVVAPLIGIGAAFLLFKDSFGGAHFAAFVAMFTTPIAVSSVPMAQEMDGDVTLAGQLVVWTTFASAVTVFLASYLLKVAGIF